MLLFQYKRTIILITHNLQRGVEMGTQCAIQVKGRIIYHQQRDKIDLANFEALYFQHVGNG